MFKTAMTKTSKAVEDPHRTSKGEQMTVYERILEVHPNADGEIRFPSLGAGSDYASFYQFVGKNTEHFSM
jgi:hypothetical protein